MGKKKDLSCSLIVVAGYLQVEMGIKLRLLSILLPLVHGGHLLQTKA
jgi:hypothetical protein